MVQEPEIVVFAMQAFVTVTTMGFSVYMMIRSVDNVTVFLPLLASLSTYWLPAPGMPAAIQKTLTQQLRAYLPQAHTAAEIDASSV